MLTPFLKLLFEGKFLEEREAEAAMALILEEADPHQTAAFLSLLKYRGETADEFAGMAAALNKKAVRVVLPAPLLDIVGTGGDLSNTVNISTGSAVLAAACGIPVAKHGNRSVSSKSGSADVLEALGIAIEVAPAELDKCLKEVGIAFMFAPFYHPSLKRIASVRKGLRLPTVFNSLGPLLNPARTEYALIGVARESSLDLMSRVILQDCSRKRTLLFHGNGLDELSTLGKMDALDIRNGRIERIEIDPESYGLSLCSLRELQGGDAQLNAAILTRAFAGERSAVSDTLSLNAGAALWIYGRAASLEDGVREAREALLKGKALDTLNKWVNFSRRQCLQEGS